MGIKPDKWIRQMALEAKMIEPFDEKSLSKAQISFGLSSYGYDMRVADEFKIFNNKAAGMIDPKKMDKEAFYDYKGEVCVIPPNSFCLARSLEYFRIPRKVMTICFGKSTYARCGIITNVTPFEPEWEGYVTMGISNTTPLPAKIYAGEGIAQVLFFEADEECAISYRDKKGKYQAQKGITLPIVGNGSV
ncbi:MAG: dCTP deaminase [Deltaproteobacteria bacterium]|nr:dCTP deaminase [Deltaproteobacteria bacterium]MBI2500687.1 dCTP deaminase [Deltaproteobacteria bacterium]MBI4197061.1 dCTP deaminase [Deltaproteobacteria bacterium]